VFLQNFTLNLDKDFYWLSDIESAPLKLSYCGYDLTVRILNIDGVGGSNLKIFIGLQSVFGVPLEEIGGDPYLSVTMGVSYEPDAAPIVALNNVFGGGAGGGGPFGGAAPNPPGGGGGFGANPPNPFVTKNITYVGVNGPTAEDGTPAYIFVGIGKGVSPKERPEMVISIPYPKSGIFNINAYQSEWRLIRCV
jgi:hypothetical protein